MQYLRKFRKQNFIPSGDYLFTYINHTVRKHRIKKKKPTENLIQHTGEINVTKCVHMEPENFNTLQKINVGNKQGATNAVISPRNLFFLLFQLAFISRVDLHKTASEAIFIFSFLNSCIICTFWDWSSLLSLHCEPLTQVKYSGRPSMLI